MKRHTFLPALAAVPAVSGGSGATPALGAYTPAAQAAAPAAAPVAPLVAPPPAPAAQATQAAQTTTDGGSLLGNLPDVSFSWSGYFEALAILCFVLALLWAVLWLVKRRGNGGGFFASSTPSMRIENRLALGPKKWLIVVRYLDRRLVLGVTDKSINLLTELYDQEFAYEPQAEKAAGKLSLAGKPSSDTRDNAPGTPGSGKTAATDNAQNSRNGKEGGLTLSFASLLKQDKGDSSQ